MADVETAQQAVPEPQAAEAPAADAAAVEAPAAGEPTPAAAEEAPAAADAPAAGEEAPATVPDPAAAAAAAAAVAAKLMAQHVNVSTVMAGDGLPQAPPRTCTAGTPSPSPPCSPALFFPTAGGGSRAEQQAAA